MASAIPREFSKTKEQIENIQNAKAHGREAEAKKTMDKADLKKEVELTEHLQTPLEGIQKLAKEFSFPPPDTIEQHMAAGLTTADAERVLHNHHYNELTPPKKLPWWLDFLLHLTDKFSLLLWSGSALCFISYGLAPENVDNLYLGSVLAVVVFLTGVFSYLQDAKSAATMEKFKDMLPQEVSVTRDGNVKQLLAKYLVPGDVVAISTGEKIAADVRVVTTKNFKADQSSLTGEPDAMSKRPENEHENPLEASNLAFFGTMAVEGEATGFIILTGDDSIIGRIAQLASGTDTDETPIAKEIHHFINIITVIAVVLGVSFFIIGFIVGYDVITNLVFMIGIIVANVPEGLLATVTVSLTLTAQRLSHKHVLVKNLESVETLGSTTCIASDKTGTLTQNRMTVQRVYVNQEIVEVPHTGVAGEWDIPSAQALLKDVGFKKLYESSVLANTGIFAEGPKDPSRPIGPGNPNNLDLPVFERLCIKGNASDYAFLKLVELMPIEPKGDSAQKIVNLRGTMPAACAGNADIPFNSAYKFMTTVREQDGTNIMYLKGAADYVFGRCSSWLVNGELVPIGEAEQAKFVADQRVMGKMGLRVLGFAYKDIGVGQWEGGNPDVCNYDLGAKCIKTNRADTSDALTFIGLMALIDPPRLAVPDSVLECRRAGVKVVMVTGDHPVTAAAIAKTVNIMPDKPVDEMIEEDGVEPQLAHAISRAIVVPGSKLKDMDQKQIQMALLYEQVVFARTSPAQKLLIVEAAQALGHVVAVTGDGVNDSPALKQADIGCAMGIAGTEVSKDAADMILLTDDFSAIVNGIEEGRLIFDNLKKSIAYTLSSNIPEISPFLMFILVRMPLSLTTVLILCVDLGTDMIPAISLAYENAESDIMMRPPRNAETDRLVTDKLIMFAYFQIGVFQALAGFFSFFCVLNDYGFPIATVPGKALSFERYPSKKDEGKPTKVRDDCPCGGGEKNNKFPDSKYEMYIKIKDGALVTGGKYSDLDAEQVAACGIGLKKYGEAGSYGNWYLDDLSSDWPYGYGCPYGSIMPTKECKFKDTATESVCYKAALALGHGQTAAFVSIVIVQWADLLICKTRSLSLYHQGMRNTVMLFGLFSETCLCLILCYVPGVDIAIGTQPLSPIHWFPSMPFSMFIFLYDETRKYILRKDRAAGKVGFVETYSYY